LNVKIPIVMLTAMNPEMEKEHALDAGANEIWSNLLKWMFLPGA